MRRLLLLIAVFGLLGVWLWPGPFARAPEAPPPAELQRRDAGLAAARVFAHPFDPASINLTADPNSGIINAQLTTCTFLPTKPTGTTAKFDCKLGNGQKIKVKYGWTREKPVELIVTRLLDALGFGADRMSYVAALRCFGCIAAPFHVRELADMFKLLDALDRHLDYSHSIDFANVAVERKLEGDGLEAGNVVGWGFYELDRIDASRGGAPREEVDALRLMAVFLNHWDNKNQNQRLVCDKHEACEHPLAIIQDTGSDLGPVKFDLEKWRARPIWRDAEGCAVTMKGMPYGGGTFSDVQISEEGRRLLSERLSAIPIEQVRALFASTGADRADDWTRAFQEKVKAISGRTCRLS